MLLERKIRFGPRASFWPLYAKNGSGPSIRQGGGDWARRTQLQGFYRGLNFFEAVLGRDGGFWRVDGRG